MSTLTEKERALFDAMLQVLSGYSPGGFTAAYGEKIAKAYREYLLEQIDPDLKEQLSAAKQIADGAWSNYNDLRARVPRILRDEFT